MRHLLELLPGEHLGSAVGRIHTFGVNGTFNKTTSALGLGTNNIRPHRLCHADDIILDTLFRTRGASQTFKDNAFGHYIGTFLTPNEQLQLEAALFGSEVIQLRIAGQSCIQQQYWRWCADCVAEDQAIYGVPFYHRDHQIPGVFHCSKHKLGLSGHCPECDFTAPSVSDLTMPPYDNTCPQCHSWMAGYEGHFTEAMEEVEWVSLRMANASHRASFSDLTDAVRNAMCLSLEDMGTLKGTKLISKWFNELDHRADPMAVAAYFTNMKLDEEDMRFPPQLRNTRLYHDQAKRDPLHPLAHLLTLQHAGYDLAGVMGFKG